MEEGFFFGCDRECLRLTEFLLLSFEVTLLVSAFPFGWLGCRGPCICARCFEIDCPCCCCVLRAVVWDGFFSFEAPPWPLIFEFFCCDRSDDSCCLLYFCSNKRYFLSRLSHSFFEVLEMLKTCTSFSVKFHSCGLRCFPRMISLDNFFNIISLLFSSICFS